MNWTKEQQLAIETREKKLIVSAAAGGGKTAVLSARIIDYLIKGGRIDKLLVVTFTNLAASEMKERIKKNLNQVLINNPNNLHLQQQLLLIEQASIMTMDAFYNKLIKENFMFLNISPDFKIIDEMEYLIIKNNKARELIEELMGNNKEITNLLDNFSDYRNGMTIEELLIKFNDNLNKRPYPDYWLDRLEQVYQVDNFNDSLWSEILYQELEIDFNSYLNLYLEVIEEIKYDDILFEKLDSFINEESKFFDKIIEAIKEKDLETIITLVKTFDLKRYPSIKGYANYPLSLKIKAMRTEFKKLLKDYNELLIKKENFHADIKTINLIIKELVMVTKLYREKLKQIREKDNFYSFDDIPPLVLKLLIKDYDFESGQITKTEVALDIEKEFDEILIDEFQDTNLVQNLIFSCLSKNENNLFIVGDVKQSIYGFRGARPDLLIKEKQKASKNQTSKLITLSKNFRSRKEVLNFCNYLFSKIMSNYYGEIDYSEPEFLNLGAYYLDNKNNEVELHLLTELTSPKMELKETELSNQEKEASVISNRIKELFDSNYQVFEPNNNQYRPLLQSDIAILLRSPGEFGNLLKDTLINNGFNVYTNRTPIYFNNYEIKLVIAILKIINNPYDEISLVAVMRSPLFAISPDLLMKIRNLNQHNNLYSNVLQMKNNPLIAKFLEKLNCYRLKAKTLNISKLLNYIYNDTKIMAIMSALDNGKIKIKNLLEMINHANKYIENNEPSLYNFISYIDTLIDNNYSFEGINPATEKDSIFITTIHQAKGLEFPIVILPRLDKEFNFKDLIEELLIDNNYYLGFKLRNHNNFTINSNLILELIKKEKKNRQLAEELRIFYVALTRTKEKLIMTGIIKNLKQKIIETNSLIGSDPNLSLAYLKTAKSMMDWVLPVAIKHHTQNELHELGEIDIKTYYNPLNLKVYLKDLNNLILNKENFKTKEVKKVDNQALIKSLNYNYPYEKINYKTKMSVSELNITSRKPLKPIFVDDKKQLIVGTTYHKILEHLSFIDYNFQSFKNAVLELVNKNIITKEELNIINLNKIFNFFKHPFYVTTIYNKAIKKEVPLFFTMKINEIDQNSKREDELIIDGIIDLVIETETIIYIIDYKSDIISNEEELINKYKKQLDLYEYALRKKTKKEISKYLYSFHLDKFIELNSIVN